MFCIFFTLIVFDEIDFFQIPAAASLLILFTIISMAFGSIYYWFKKWYLVGMFCVTLFISMLYGNGFINKVYQVESLDYNEIQGYNKNDLLDYKSKLNDSKDSLNTIKLT